MEPALQIVLTLAADGKLAVNAGGPQANSKTILLCLLEAAKQVSQQPEAPAQTPGLLLARGALPKFNGR